VAYDLPMRGAASIRDRHTDQFDPADIPEGRFADGHFHSSTRSISAMGGET
jgi:hypothetical protein